MRKSGLAAVVALCLVGTSAFAQPAASASPKALALSHRLILAMHMTESFEVMMRAMLPQMVEVQAKRIPGFRPEWRQPLLEATQEAATEDLMPALIKRAEPLYAQTFTEDELEKAVAFYESSAGQAMVRKAPTISPKLMGDFSAMVAALGQDVAARFCKKIGGCDKPPEAGPTKS